MKLLLEHIGLNRKKFYQWRSRFGKPNNHNGKMPKEHWLLPEEVKAITTYARKHFADGDYFIKDGYRRMTYDMMDKNIAVAAPSTVYRILKRNGLLNQWNTAKRKGKGKGFNQPDAPHRHWHTDIKYLNYCGTFFFLISVLDGYSRYVLHHEVRAHMGQYDVQLIIQKSKEKYPDAKPRLITDNGSQFISKEFKSFINNLEMTHVKTSIAYPQSNGKIERFNRTISEECLRIESYLSLSDLRLSVARYINHYNSSRLHGSLNYLTPEDYLLGRKNDSIMERENKMIDAELRGAQYWERNANVA